MVKSILPVKREVNYPLRPSAWTTVDVSHTFSFFSLHTCITPTVSVTPCLFLHHSRLPHSSKWMEYSFCKSLPFPVFFTAQSPLSLTVSFIVVILFSAIRWAISQHVGALLLPISISFNLYDFNKLLEESVLQAAKSAFGVNDKRLTSCSRDLYFYLEKRNSIIISDNCVSGKKASKILHLCVLAHSHLSKLFEQ